MCADPFLLRRSRYRSQIGSRIQSDAETGKAAAGRAETDVMLLLQQHGCFKIFAVVAVGFVVVVTAVEVGYAADGAKEADAAAADTATV